MMGGRSIQFDWLPLQIQGRDADGGGIRLEIRPNCLVFFANAPLNENLIQFSTEVLLREHVYEVEFRGQSSDECELQGLASLVQRLAAFQKGELNFVEFSGVDGSLKLAFYKDLAGTLLSGKVSKPFGDWEMQGFAYRSGLITGYGYRCPAALSFTFIIDEDQLNQLIGYLNALHLELMGVAERLSKERGQPAGDGTCAEC